MFYNFTPRAQKVLELAFSEAKRLHHQNIGTEHLMLGIIALRLKIGSERFIAGTQIDLLLLKEAIEKEVHSCDPASPVRKLPYTAPAKKALALAYREARSWGHLYVGYEHILLGLLQFDNTASRIIQNLGPTIIEKVELRLFGGDKHPVVHLAASILRRPQPRLPRPKRALITGVSVVIITVLMMLVGIFYYLPLEHAKFLEQAKRHWLISDAKPD